MMQWLLRQLEQNPQASFTAERLLSIDPAGFEVLRRRGILQWERPGPPGMRFVEGRVLTIASDGDERAILAFDAESPDEPLVEVPDEVEAVWSADIDAIAAWLGERWSLDPDPVWLSGRVLQLGTTTGGARVSLALLPATDAVRRELAAMDTQPDRSEVVVFPSVKPTRRDREWLTARGFGLCWVIGDSCDLRPTVQELASVPSADGGLADEPLAFVPSFRWLRVDGVEHTPSENQSLCLQQLHRAGGAVHEAAVIELLVDAFESNRFADVFRGSPLMGTYVIRLGKGMFKLKYY